MAENTEWLDFSVVNNACSSSVVSGIVGKFEASSRFKPKELSSANYAKLWVKHLYSCKLNFNPYK